MADSAEFNFMKAVVVKPHQATDETQLELRLNDVVYVLEQDDSGWWGGHKEGEDCTGWFPGSCVRELENQEHLAQSPPCAGRLSLVPEEYATSEDALLRDDRMVASPNRRVSQGTIGEKEKRDSVAVSTLQAELRTMSAIAEDRAREIQRLEAERAKGDAALKAEVSVAKAEASVARRQLEDLTSQLEVRTTEVRTAETEADRLREQLAKAKKELCEVKTEVKTLSKHYERRLQEKDAEIREALQQQGQIHQDEQATDISVASHHQTAEEQETRRRLFASTADETPLFPGARGTPSFSMNDVAQMRNDDVTPVNTEGTVHSNASSVETVPRTNTFRQPPQLPQTAPFRPAPSPAPSTPGNSAPYRPHVAARPAFQPSASSPQVEKLQSPLRGAGIAKCRSTPDLPPTPRLDKEDTPVRGSVREKIGLFEQVAQRCATPRRSASVKAGPPRSMTSDTPGITHPPLVSSSAQRSPYSAPRSASCKDLRQASSHGLRLDLNEAQDALEQVNFNMSPMTRYRR